MFFITNVKSPSQSFNILDFVTFSVANTRSSSTKLVHKRSQNNLQRHFYFGRLVKLWNALPIIDLSLSTDTLRRKVKDFLWSNFVNNFDSSNTCSFHFLCPCIRCSSTPKPPNYCSFHPI